MNTNSDAKTHYPTVSVQNEILSFPTVYKKTEQLSVKSSDYKVSTKEAKPCTPSPLLPMIFRVLNSIN